ncbi:MAG: BlaI/MecI/CopY family transcriptional regulator [Oscillospiraceae bacterium]|nr:BlaI/MecI/CopY family transcriptional regulator [Oscillospiraceae bacterium]
MAKMILSDGEWRIMNLLWVSSPRRVPELTEALQGDTGWSRATVNMMLNRLEEKGAVASEVQGRAKVYYPLLSQADARQKETARFLDRLYGGSLGLMVSSMAGQQALSEADLNALRAILAEAEEKEKTDAE